MSGHKAIRVDMSGFESFKKLNGKEQAAFMDDTAKELALRFLSSVTRKTPVGRKPNYVKDIIGNKRWRKVYKEHWKGYVGGTLRRRWFIRSGFKFFSSNGAYDVFNPTEYASYVNDGYFQRSRFVPALGLRVKNRKIEGQNFVKKAEEKLNAEKLVKTRLRQRLRRIFGNG